MAWKPTGHPAVRRQRDKWVVRVDGIDTVTGKRRPRQLGTLLLAARRRSAAASRSRQQERSAASAARSASSSTSGRPAASTSAIRPDCSTSGRPSASSATSAPSASTNSIAKTSPAGSRSSPPAATTPGAASGSSAWCCGPRWRRRRSRRHPPQPSGTGRHAPARRQARPPTRGPGVDRGRGATVRRLDQRSPVGGTDAPLRALRAAPQRTARAALVMRRPEARLGAHRARPRRGPRPPGVVRRQERPVASDDRDRRVDRAIARRPPQVPGRGATPRRCRLGRQRPRRGDEERHTGVARQLRPDPGATDRQGRRAAAQLARAASHRRHADGSPRHRHRRDPRRRRPARPQPRHADAHLRPRPARVDQRGDREDRRAGEDLP